MKLLMIGGTQFLGRHLVEAATARGHEVTLFNRGQHDPQLFPELEKLRGDRDGNLDALRGRRWDAVIDTCGFVPRVVSDSAELLAGAVERYVFISTLSVYADFSRPVEDESAPLATTPDESAEEVTGANYGALKALCERAVEDALPGRALTIRPGLIVGPHDTTVRFVYWPRRVARGGEVLAPGNPEGQVQFIDARDLAAWTVRMVEEGRAGVYNANGPGYRLTMKRVLDECKAIIGGDARFTWVGQSFLLEAGVEPWSELPLWMPEDDGKFRYFLAVGSGKAIEAGLTFRPLEETIRDTLAWDAIPDKPPATDRHGVLIADKTLRPERESELLRAWHNRQG